MATRRTPQIAARKLPQQSRSSELVAAILQAATHVLSTEGAQRFTTARVAERAGVSVGSVYQYFPNKAAILFRLQTDEWAQTTQMLRAILADRRRAPISRLRILVHAFIKSECEEAAMRVALNDAAPLYRDAPEAKAAKAEGDEVFAAFMEEVLPRVPRRTQAVAADLITKTLSSVGKEFSAADRSPSEIRVLSDAMADMFAAYIGALSQG